MELNLYSKKPIGHHGSIPVFSESNKYIENYNQISIDHLDSYRKTGKNPWIPEELWLECENSTALLIKRYSKQKDRILDVGVGMGRLMAQLPEWKRYGMDISYNYLKIAQKKGIEVCYSLIEDMPYHKNFFDAVVCTDVLEHVFDLNECCMNILSVLKNKGKLFVRVPYREDMSQYLQNAHPYKYIHLRNFDENTLRLLFEKVFDCRFIEMSTCGFKYGRLKSHFSFHKTTHILRRLLSPIDLISKPFYRLLVSKIFFPCEINMVFEKKY